MDLKKNGGDRRLEAGMKRLMKKTYGLRKKYMVVGLKKSSV